MSDISLDNDYGMNVKEVEGMYIAYNHCNSTDDVRYRIYSRYGYIECIAYKVVKYTPKGVQIELDGNNRFVSNDATNKFAHDTIKNALNSFLCRKNRQKKILTAQINNINEEIVIAKELINKIK